MKNIRTVLPLVLMGIILVFSAATVLSQDLSDEGLAEAAGTPILTPEQAKLQKNPFANDAASIETGKQYFSSQCTMCHGADGRGTGRLVERLKLEMPDFTSEKMHAKRTDGELFYIVTMGHGEMPGQKDRLNDEIKWALVNYVRALRMTE